VRRALLAIAVCLAGLALVPSTAFGSAGTTTIELSRSGPRTFDAGGRNVRFTLAGVHWRGSGTVELRTRSETGQWSGWRAGGPEDEDGPDVGTREGSPKGWRVGNPWWVGGSRRIEVRTHGEVTRVRAHLVWSPETRIPLRMPSATVAPPIVPRSTWGADERIRRGPPSYATDVRLSIVHHTAGRNSYTRAEAAAIVKGIQLFHVQGNGWNDIGYNFLVDRFGTIYEGRFGGIDRNVIGAHAQGFNTGSVGIALLGTFGSAGPSAAARDAIAGLIAWRLDVAHVDPTSFLTFISGGSDRFRTGLPVLLGAVSGHRDTGFTECPGDLLYGRLSELASNARAAGGLKIFEPRVEVAGPAIRVRARLSQAQTWAVRFTRPDGSEVVRGSGSGSVVDWTWDSAGASPGSYTWAVSAGAARPATGTVRAGGGAAPLAIEVLSAEPEAISPNGDGQADATTITYRISAAANVSVEVMDSIGNLVATVVDRVWTRAGQHVVAIDGEALPDGDYNVFVTARTAAGVPVETVIPLAVNRTLGLVTVTPAAFSPNGDGRKDVLALSFALSAPADVRVRIERDGRWVATPLVGGFVTGTQRLAWDGQRTAGLVRDGDYRAVVEATTATGVISYGLPFVTDTVPPRVRVLPGRGVRIEVSEPSMLTLVVDGQSLKHEVRKAGIVRVPWSGHAARVRVVAWDDAGNASGPAVRVGSG
jgi:N-acetylmuramoyl-L-alanine amidase